MQIKPKISIVIPFHWMKNWQFFLTRCLESIESQEFKDYEIILMKVGSMPITSNKVIESAMGELVKVLYMDDLLAHPSALGDIVGAMEGQNWLITGADTNPNPYWTDNIETGNNHLGSPSALTMRRESAMLFDEELSWLLDCDLYKRMYARYGPPKILSGVNVLIGVGDHQMTNILTDEDKLKEHNYLNKKYE